MWLDRVSNPGPLTYESGALPTALRGLAITLESKWKHNTFLLINLLDDNNNNIIIVF